jgi:hypothetical protein
VHQGIAESSGSPLDLITSALENVPTAKAVSNLIRGIYIASSQVNINRKCSRQLGEFVLSLGDVLCHASPEGLRASARAIYKLEQSLRETRDWVESFTSVAFLAQLVIVESHAARFRDLEIAIYTDLQVTASLACIVTGGTAGLEAIPCIRGRILCAVSCDLLWLDGDLEAMLASDCLPKHSI